MLPYLQEGEAVRLHPLRHRRDRNRGAATRTEWNSPAAAVRYHRIEWNGMEWNGMEWNGMEWNGMEWNGMEWNGMEWNGMEYL